MKKIIFVGIVLFVICFMFRTKGFNQDTVISEIDVTYQSDLIELSDEQEKLIADILQNMKYRYTLDKPRRVSIEENPLEIDFHVNHRPMHLILGELDMAYTSSDALFWYYILDADVLQDQILQTLKVV